MAGEEDKTKQEIVRMWGLPKGGKEEIVRMRKSGGPHKP